MTFWRTVAILMTVAALLGGVLWGLSQWHR